MITKIKSKGIDAAVIKIRTVWMLMTLLLCLLSGCGMGSEDGAGNRTESGDEGGAQAQPVIEQFVIGTTSAIEKATGGEYAYDMLASGVSELPLVCQDTEGNYHPMLASYETNDATTWTYRIVDGMTWSDGVAVTAEDILFTLQYEDSNGSANLTEQVNEKGVKTAAKYTGYQLSEDKKSISLTLAAANVRELSNMTSFRVLPKHIYEGNVSLSETDMRVSCGPYVFEDFHKEAGTISFVVNSYYPERPHINRIVYRLFGNEDTMYMALQQGDIDMVWSYSTGVSAAYQDILANSSSVKLVNVPAANVPAVLAFNNANGLFADENMRKAVANALDYEAFRKYIGSSYAQLPNAGFVPNTTIGFHNTAQLKKDDKTAAEYLARSGYSTKNADGFYVNADGKELGFTLTVRADKTAHVSCADLIKTQLEAFGIRVTIEAIDSDSYNAKTSNKFSENHITMEAALFGYTAAGMGMMNGLATIYVDGSHAVQGGCQVFEEQFRNIQDELAAAKTIEQYQAAAGKMQDYYAQKIPLVALYWDNMMYACSAEYDNLTVDYVFGLNNVRNWFSIQAVQR